VKIKFIFLLATIVGIFFILKIDLSDEAATSVTSNARGPTREIREPGDANRRVQLRQPISALDRKRIAFYAGDGLESFGDFADRMLDSNSKALLIDLVNSGDFHAALDFLSDLDSESLKGPLYYTLSFRWARIDRDACLAAMTSADLSPEVKHDALKGIFHSVASEPNSDTFLWVENMLTKTASVPGLDERLWHIGSGWVTTGVMRASDFVSLWERIATRMEEPLSSRTIFESLRAIANGLLAGNGLTLVKSGGLANEHMIISDSEMSSISADILGLFDRLPVPDDEERWGRARSLASSLGRIEGLQNGPTQSLSHFRAPSDPVFREVFFEGVGSGLSKHRTAEIIEMVRENKPEHALVWKGYVADILARSGHADLFYDITNPSGQSLPEALQVQAAGQIASSMLHRDAMQASKQIAAMPDGAIKSEMVSTLIAYLQRVGRNDEAEEWKKMN